MTGPGISLAPDTQNVILIVSDTLRRDCVSVYGEPGWFNRPVHTPHLERLAAISTVFDRAFISSFPTVPLRNDLITGRATYAYKTWSPLGPDEITLQDQLNQHGILTGLVVDTPHPFAPSYNYQRNFASWELIRGQELDPWKASPREPVLPCAPEKLRRPESVKQYLRNTSWWSSEEDTFVARTMRYAADWIERNHHDRFFLYVDTFDPHEPWTPPQHYTDMYDPGYTGEEVIYPLYDYADYLTPAELQHSRALYAGEVTLVDRWVGHLIDRIESLGLLTNTAIIFISDHGFYFGEHNYIGKSLIKPQYQQALRLYPEVCRIPFFIHLPGQQDSIRTGALAQPLDLPPTILNLFGQESPPSFAGHSLLGPLHGGSAARECAISSTSLWTPGQQNVYPDRRATVTDGDWMLIFGPRGSIGQEEYTAMVDSVVRKTGLFEESSWENELYNLTNDPGALHNVIHEREDVARRLHTCLMDDLTRNGVPASFLENFSFEPGR